MAGISVENELISVRINCQSASLQGLIPLIGPEDTLVGDIVWLARRKKELGEDDLHCVLQGHGDVMHRSGSQHPVWQDDLADLVGVQTVHVACERTSDYTTDERADVWTGHIFRQHCSSRIQMELEPPSTISRVSPNTLWIRPRNYDDGTHSSRRWPAHKTMPHPITAHLCGADFILTTDEFLTRGSGDKPSAFGGGVFVADALFGGGTWPIWDWEPMTQECREKETGNEQIVFEVAVDEPTRDEGIVTRKQRKIKIRRSNLEARTQLGKS